MTADKLFNVRKDKAARKLAANNRKMKENPGKTGVSTHGGYDGEKG
ncbi:MAG: hypothetical protein GX750_05710 [Clostridia bacterium]|nr:hypothetical protein [Clostridia bacterium]